MSKYYYSLLAVILLAIAPSFPKAAPTSLLDSNPILTDSLVNIDTTAISEHIWIIREITQFKEIILDDTLTIDSKLQIKKITVEHITIALIDTIYLLDESAQGENPKTDTPLPLTSNVNTHTPNPYSFNFYLQQTEEEIPQIAESTGQPLKATTPIDSPPMGIEEAPQITESTGQPLKTTIPIDSPPIEETLIVAESTGQPIDITTPILTNPPPSNTTLNHNSAPASRAGLPGAKILERRVITPKEAYQLTLSEIEKRRQYYAKDLAQADNSALQQQILKNAANYLEESIAIDVVHYWYGTSFDKEGMAKNPNEGKIACSYFITTVLEDAGLKLNRIKLSQQSAQNITKTLCNPQKTKRLTTPSEAKNYVVQNGKGLYVIGFSFHVGFLYNDGTNIYLIHASPLPPGTVARLPMQGARSFDYSKFYDIGKLSDNQELIRKWLKGEKISISH